MAATVAAFFAIVATLSTVSFAQAPDLRSLFPHRAPLLIDPLPSSAGTVPGGGLARLHLPPEVLRACRADLSDLRLIDGSGAQIPFLVDDERTRPDDASLMLQRRVDPRILDVSRQRLGTPDDESSRRQIERIVFEMPRLGEPDPPVPGVPTPGASTPGADPARWDLVLSARRARFVRRVEVTALDAVGARRTVIEGASVFRLPESRYEKLRLALPQIVETRIELLLEGRDGSFLEPSIVLESRRGLRALGEASIGLEITTREERDGATQLVVERPAGIRPGQIEIATSTRLFRRPVELRDLGSLGGGKVAGAVEIFRLDDGITIERLRVEVADLAALRGSRLGIVIDNGDSPPLDDLAVAAIVVQPALVFAPPPASSRAAGGETSLYFGGARAHRPRYDIAQLLEAPGSGPESNDRVEVAARLLDAAANAVLGEIAENPFFDRSPPLAFAMRAGAELDGRRYSHRRVVRAAPSAEGLSRLDLGLEDLAVARADLGDLRLVDSESRQWAYLFGNQDESVDRELTVSRESKDGWSTYELALPAAPADLQGLVIDAEVPFFDRRYRVEARVDGETGSGRREIQSGRLARSAPDRSPIEMAWSSLRVTEIVLQIEDGDDRPLELTMIHGRLVVRPLYFAAPAGDYQLLFGYPDDRPPQYELRRARDLVLALDAGAAELGPLEDNPLFRRGSRVATTQGGQRVLLWGAVLLAVAVLTVLTLRLARAGPDS